MGSMLTFDHEDTKDFLSSASVLIAVEIGSLKPIYRAEWNYCELINEIKHAQPHWHALMQKHVFKVEPLDDVEPFEADFQNSRAEDNRAIRLQPHPFTYVD